MEAVEYAMIDVNEGEDSISQLPDDLLAEIISFLPFNEAVRTSVLSTRWKTLWRFTSKLNFDQTLMLNAAAQSKYLAFPNRDQKEYLDFPDPTVRAGISESESLINSVLDNHCCSLTSCRIMHLIESCDNGHAVGWIRKLLEEKRVKEISMECVHFVSWGYAHPDVARHALTLDLPLEIISRFHVLELKNYVLKTSLTCAVSQNLKTLKFSHVLLNEEMLEGIISNCLSIEKLSLLRCKISEGLKIHSPSIKFLELREMMVHRIDVSAVNLGVIELDTMICKPRGLVIDAPNLRVFHSHCDLKFDLAEGNILLTTREILETCSGLLSPEGSSHTNIFKNLTTLCIVLNLNNVRDAVPLSFVLRSCPRLQNLEIYNKEQVEFSNGCLPYPSSMFWQRREFCERVNLKLKTVYITGYKGKELEVEFVKYLITNARMIERITICFDDDSTWEGATATVSLLSIARDSVNLSITLKPGKEYLAKVGGSMENWISTLKLN